MITPVLLAGGSGSRLWPASREAFPKQFTKFFGDNSLFQQAALRVSGPQFSAPLIVTSDQFRFTVSDQMSDAHIIPDTIILEPSGLNTAPAVLVASLWAAARDPNALLLIAPSDHIIPNENAFRAAVTAASPDAEQGQIVTFGIKPDHPEIGYGYLELEQSGAEACIPLKRFIEKPDMASAEAMVKSDKYLWNAGIFLFRADVMLSAFNTFAPDMVPLASESLKKAQSDLGFLRLDAEAWAALPSISIDYAIMEHAKNLSVFPFDGQWSDLGSWAAVAEQSFTPRDAFGNQTSQNAHAINCENSFLYSDDGGVRLVAIGLKDVVAISTDDAVLIVPKNQSQLVREAVDLLKQQGAKQATEFRRDHRPWGWFESLALGSRFQVKRIVVKPGGILSLQSHKHRAEHWIVVEGMAKVTIGRDVKMVHENESVYVPLGALHRMENPGKVPMVLIEVQTGSYLGEDDITRYEDLYQRS